MDYIENNPKLFEYCLIENNILQTEVYKLTLKEAKAKNYAYALNRSCKRFVLKSNTKTDTDNSIIILPERS